MGFNDINTNSSTLQEDIVSAAKHYKELDDARVIDYCRLGVEDGNSHCAYMLAEYYRVGKFVEKNVHYAAELYEKCIQWYQSTEDGDVYDALEPLCSACLALGELYANKLLPDSTTEKAFYYYKLGADSGSDDACYKVAEMYEQGIGTAANYEEAAKYYGKYSGREKVPEVTAALIRLAGRFEESLAQCLYALGGFYQCYSNNEEQAKACYAKSFELGCLGAGFKLQKIRGRNPREIYNEFKGSFVASLDVLSVDEQPPEESFSEEDLPF